MGQTEYVKINVGRMVEKLTLYKPIVTKSTTGQRLTTHVKDVTILADITENSTQAAKIDNNLTSKVILKFNSYYRNGITVDWKVEYEGEKFDIESVIPDSRKIMAQYACSKKLNG